MNRINCFIPSFMLLLVKMGKQCYGSTVRLFPIGGFQEGAIKTLTLHIPTQYVVVSAILWDGSFGRFDKGTAEVLISLLNIGGTRRY